MSAVMRVATAADVALMLDWAAAEGWNPGLDDTAPFHAADPDGFFIAVEDEKILAAISVVNHSDDYAFLGLNICAPEARGRGSRGVRSAEWDTESNIRLEIICNRELAERIAEHLQVRYYDNFAMVCYLAEVEVLRPEKF